MVTLEKSAKLRIGIKWNPIERDNLKESLAIDPDNSRARLAQVSSQIKFLWWYRKILFATYFLRNRSRHLSKLVAAKKEEAQKLQDYLSGEGEPSHDLDLCCCCYDRRGQMVKFVSPRTIDKGDTTRTHLNGQMAFVHSGDDHTGTGGLIDEEIRINVSAIAPDIHQIFFVIASLHYGFHEVDGCSWSIMTTRDEKVILSKAVDANLSHRIYMIAKLERKELSWTLKKLDHYFPMEIESKSTLGNQLHELIKQHYLITGASAG